MSETIKGLNWDIPSTKVKELLQVRIDQCDKKTELYEKQADAQAKLTEGMQNEELEFAKHSTDQSENLRRKAVEYRERSKMYVFLRDNVIKDASYRLDRGDLEFLGVVKNRY